MYPEGPEGMMEVKDMTQMSPAFSEWNVHSELRKYEFHSEDFVCSIFAGGQKIPANLYDGTWISVGETDWIWGVSECKL